MLNFLENVYNQTVDRISGAISTYAPGLIAGLLIVVVAYILAKLVRWVLSRIFKGIAIDRFLRQSGLFAMVDRSGKAHAADLVASAAFWVVFLGGVLTAISALDTQLTTRITETAVFLAPKLLAAAAIIVAGIWLGRYLSRHTLVWAVNEGIPSGRRIATGVRILVIFIAVAAAADYLNFARYVFLAALILVLGGIVLAASLSFGLSGHDLLKRHLQEKGEKSEEKDSMSYWKHL
jgi:hypothetical protein